LLEGKECLGPITVAGCDALCPSNNVACYGCRGPLNDANIKQYKAIAKEQGYDEIATKLRFETFAGLKIKQVEENQNQEKK
jgi:sulfhydrogenase subunit delta